MIKRNVIESLVEQRDQILDHYNQAIDSIVNARKMSETVSTYGLHDLVGQFYNADGERKRVREKLDRSMWNHVIEQLNIRALMTAKQTQALNKQLNDDPMVFNAENIQSTLLHLTAKSGDIFEQSVVDLYQTRCFKFKTNDPNRFGQKIILDGAYDANSQYMSYYRKGELYDLDKVVHLISGQAPPERHSEGLVVTLENMRSCGSYTYEVETPFFKVKKFKKGSLHILIKDAEVVEQMNCILAAHFDGKAVGGKRHYER